MKEVLVISQVLATSFLVWHSICALNSMSHKTSHGVRAGVILISVGCFFELTQTVLLNHIPDAPEVMTMIGLAIGTAYNRRGARCPCIMNGTEFCTKSSKKTPIKEVRDEHRHA